MTHILFTVRSTRLNVFRFQGTDMFARGHRSCLQNVRFKKGFAGKCSSESNGKPRRPIRASERGEMWVLFF